MFLMACRRPPQPGFDLETAIMRAFLAMGVRTQDRAAMELGISPELFGRQIKSLEHLSFQRLLQIRDPRFWVSLLGSMTDHYGASLVIDSDHLRRDVLRLLVQLNRFSVSMLKDASTPVQEKKRA